MILITFDNFADLIEDNFCSHREIASGQCSMIKMEEGADNPMVKAADKVAEAFVLFAQVLDFVVAVVVMICTSKRI